MEQAPTIEAESAAIEEEFDLFEDQRDKIEYICDLGRALPKPDEALTVEANKVRGCQSQVWMVARFDETAGVMRYRAWSDAVIVRGLIGLLLRLYDNRPPQAINDNPPEVFDRIGLGRHLTTQRAGGLSAMVARMRELAAAHRDEAA